MKKPHRFYRASLGLVAAVLVAATLGPAGTAFADPQINNQSTGSAVTTATPTNKAPQQQAAPATPSVPGTTPAAPQAQPGPAQKTPTPPAGQPTPPVAPAPASPKSAPAGQPAEPAAAPQTSSQAIAQPQTSGRLTVPKSPSATALAAQIKEGKADPATLIKEAYARIATLNPSLNSVIYQDEANAMAQLKAMQEAGGQDRPFYGVPLLIKGLGQSYKGWPDTNGLTFQKDHKAGYTKSFVAQLQKLGFIILGQTNFPELGLINVTTSLLNGDAHNPWDLTRNPGGSSGGSTAAVAAGLVPVATGNDAGGSLRIPASWSGVIGMKPTQGLIIGDPASPSVVNFAESESIDDTTGLLKGLMNPKSVGMLQMVPQDLTGMKIAYSLVSPVGTPVSEEAKQAVLQAVAFLRQQGFTVVEQAAPVDGIQLMQNYFLAALSDGSVANLQAQYYLKRKLTVADVTNGVISPMTYALYQASLKAPKDAGTSFKNELALVKQAMTTFHQEYPIYLTPTTATVAPENSDPAFLPDMVTKLTQIGQLSFPDQMKLIYDAWLHGLTKTPFTQLANLAGEPALSLPTYVSPAGLPLGIQLEGAPGADFTLLALGKLFENQHQFKFLSDQLPLAPAQPTVPAANQPDATPGAQPAAYGGMATAGSMAPMVGHHTGASALALHQPQRGMVTVMAAGKARQQSQLPQTGNATSLAALVLGTTLGIGLLIPESLKRMH